MTKKKLIIIGASTLSVALVASLSVAVVYKWNKQQEYNAYWEQQMQQQAAAASSAAAAELEKQAEPIKIPKIKPIQPKKPKQEASSSVPQVIVEEDAQGNEVITPEWTKPEPPSSSALHDPTTPPKTETPKPKTDDDGIRYDNNGNQIPNEKGEVYVPGFGWLPQASGGKSESVHNAGTGDIIGY